LSLRNALVFFYVLAISTKTAFLLTNGQFEFFVEAMDPIEIPGPEEFKQEGGYLREITEGIFHLAIETVVLGAVGHKTFVAETKVPGSAKICPNRLTKRWIEHPC
jgi:hypothetical protein